MPRVGADGNEMAGVPSVLFQAPLGTYIGWNVITGGLFKGQPCGGGLTGGYIPFARSRSERLASGDPRPSLAERYGSQDGYMCKVRAAVTASVRDRVLLPEDAGRLVAEAARDAPLAGIEAGDAERDIVRTLCTAGDETK